MHAKGWAVLGVLGLLALMALAQWYWFGIPLDRDEGEYAYSAWRLADGGVPYRDAFMQKPPMVIYTYWLAQRWSDSAVWPPRVLAWIFVAATMGLVGWIAKRAGGDRCSWAAMALFVPMASFPFLGSIAANTEKFMNLPMMAVVALHVVDRTSSRAWRWGAAGACASIALLYKPICLPVLAFVFTAWSIGMFRSQGFRRAGIRLVALVVGAAAAAAAALAWIGARGALGDLWAAAVDFNRAYAGISGWMLGSSLRYARTFLFAWPSAVLLTIAFACGRSARKGYWLGLLAIALGVANLDQNGHYFIMAIPFWALVAAFGLDDLASRLPGIGRIHWYGVLAVVSAVVLWLPLRPVLGLSPRRLSQTFLLGNPFAESAEVARRVAELTQPDDGVFVEGSEPQILFHAKRKSSTRFVIAYPLTLPTRFQFAYQQEVLEALRTEPPEVVVWVSSSMSWLSFSGPMDRHARYVGELQSMLANSYLEVGGFVPSPGGGAWREPLDDAERPLATLRIYRRNGGRPGPPGTSGRLLLREHRDEHPHAGGRVAGRGQEMADMVGGG